MRAYERDEVVPLDQVEVPSCCILPAEQRLRAWHGAAVWDAWASAQRSCGDIDKRLMELDGWHGCMPLKVRVRECDQAAEAVVRERYCEVWRAMDERAQKSVVLT